MKKNIVIITILALASISQMTAQITDRLVPHFGYMYTIFGMTSEDQTARFNQPFNTLSVGTYYTLKQAKDIVSIGLDPNINASLGFSPLGTVNWYVQVPVFVMGRVGANSTVYNTQKIGLGAGIGVMGTYMNFLSPTFLVPIRGTYFNPAAVVEGTLNVRGSNVTGRIMFTLSDARRTGNLFDVEGNFFTSVLSLGIIYGL